MKLRISGTRAECAATVAVLAAAVHVREVSEYYPNRRASTIGRVYLDADAPKPGDETPEVDR